MFDFFISKTGILPYCYIEKKKYQSVFFAFAVAIMAAITDSS